MQMSKVTPSLFALTFRIKMQYRFVKHALIAALMPLHRVKIW